MRIENHQLITDGGAIDLPHLAIHATVTVWEVPTEYRDNGLFVAVVPFGQPQEVPACDHGAPIFAASLPAHPDAVLAVARAAKWEAIKAERDRRKGLGVKVGEKWFHSDDASRIQQLALVMMGAGIPAGLQWKTMDGSFVTMTQALAGQIFQATAASDQAIFARAEQHKAAMQASDQPAAYDFADDWPEAFEEQT